MNFEQYDFWQHSLRPFLLLPILVFPNLLTEKKYLFVFKIFQIQLNLHLSRQLSQDDILKSTKLQMYR